MERVPDDLWRIVFAFAGPTPGARQVAARARTLDEFVEYRLVGEPDNYHESRTIEEGVAHTGAQINLVHALRTVSKQWRDLITYGSTRQLTLKAISCVDLPPDFATRFGGCEAFTIDGDGGDYTRQAGSDSLPAALQDLNKLRSLSMRCMTLQSLPAWFGALPLVELYIDYGMFRGESFQEDGRTITPINGIHQTNPVRAWESDPHVLPRTLEVLCFNVCTRNAALECVRLLPRLRELRIGSRNFAPSWFHELTSLRRFEVYPATGLDDWGWVLSAMSLESINFQVDDYRGDDDDFSYSLGTMILQEDASEEDDDASAETESDIDETVGEALARRWATLPLSRLGESLREIHLGGLMSHRPECPGVTRLPECLLRLPRLEHLDLSGNFELEHLPDDLGLLPLVVLDLSWTGVRTLPASLQTTATLRVLEIWQGGWLAGPCRHYQTGEFYLQAGRDHIKLANAADEIARRDAVLRPLSLALPELRILMHANDMARTPKGASMRWWHARCGYDWTDPVFF